jgi:hypothetical protein
VAEKRNMDKISYLRLSKSDVERKLTEYSQHIPEYKEGIKKTDLAQKIAPSDLLEYFTMDSHWL